MTSNIGKRDEKHATWRYVEKWAVAMKKKHGGRVWEGGEWMDWGQALCRELYGPEWTTSGQLKILNSMSKSEPLPKDIIALCNKWQEGWKPDWVTRYSPFP